MKAFAVVATVLCLAVFAGAEERPLTKVVRVTGTSEVKVEPDRAVIELGVEKEDPSASVAKRAEDAASRRILAALRANGIDEKDIRTTFLSLQPQAGYRKHVRFTYFVAAQTLSVTVRDITRLDALLESLVKAGGNRIDSIVYETSDLRKYRDQARELAVKAAREKALALAQALGQQIGKAQSIEEVPEPANPYVAVQSNVAYEYEGAMANRRGPATAAGQRSVFASVVVSFDLN